ncbi:MAG: diguanylate cyclase [Methylomonas lenta]|nr:diguanylate cyclase [Methylomonas lenta]
MNTVSAKSNIYLLSTDNDLVNRGVYKQAFGTFQEQHSESIEEDTGHHGLELASIHQSECVLLDQHLPNTAVLSEQAENVSKPNLPAEMQTESVEALREQREQQMLLEKTVALEQLREAEAKYRTLVEQIPVITYIASLETPVKLLYVSPQISQLGFPADDWLAEPQGLLKRVHPDDLAATIEAYTYTYEHHVPLRCEYRLTKHDGQSRWFLDKAIVVRNEAGESMFLQGVLVDITKDKEIEQELSYYRQRLEEMVCNRTEQLEKQCAILKSANASLGATLGKLKRANTKVRNSERRFRLLLDATSEGIVGFDADGHCSFVNRAALIMLGYAEKDLLGQDILSTIDQPNTDDFTLPLEALVHSNLSQGLASERCLTSFKRKDGHSFPVEYSFYPVEPERLVDNAVLVFLDMTASHAQIQSLEYQASHDPLTGLVNRTAFEQRLSRVLESAKSDHSQHALCYLDLDHFKRVNDICGHAAGDELLRRLSSVLASKLRQRDTLARLGGDEFALLLEHTTLNQARNIAHELCESLRNFCFTWEDTDFSISTSIGLAIVTRNIRDAGEFLNNADSACYRAKKKGRNQVHIFIPDNIKQLDQFVRRNS